MRNMIRTSWTILCQKDWRSIANSVTWALGGKDVCIIPWVGGPTQYFGRIYFVSGEDRPNYFSRRTTDHTDFFSSQISIRSKIWPSSVQGEQFFNASPKIGATRPLRGWTREADSSSPSSSWPESPPSAHSFHPRECADGGGLDDYWLARPLVPSQRPTASHRPAPFFF